MTWPSKSLDCERKHVHLTIWLAVDIKIKIKIIHYCRSEMWDVCWMLQACSSCTWMWPSRFKLCYQTKWCRKHMACHNVTCFGSVLIQKIPIKFLLNNVSLLYAKLAGACGFTFRKANGWCESPAHVTQPWRSDVMSLPMDSVILSKRS